jgi:hypothetical protein
MRQTFLLSALMLVLMSAAASAQSGFAGSSTGGGFHAPVPVSSFARASSWVDPQRLHITTSVSMGGVSGGSGMDALQVTSFSYQFRAPLSMSVSVGNAWGPSSGGNNSLFLEGLRMAWLPSAGTAFTFEFHQVRSPLQYGFGGYGPGSGYGYAQPRW